LKNAEKILEQLSTLAREERKSQVKHGSIAQEKLYPVVKLKKYFFKSGQVYWLEFVSLN